ncbi:MAG: DUF4339 domain-containing protein, partial [Sphingobacteriales bacterium]
MNRYLLLRDNKQSGPYTVSELVEKGIKAYDLVWLDGRSAAWRYPSEIDELRAHSPAVEEQPYDRFYKKPASQQKHRSEVERHPTENHVAGALVTPTANTPKSAAVPEVPVHDHAFLSSAHESNSSRLALEKAASEIPSIQNDQPRKIYVTLPGKTGKPVSNITARQVTTPQTTAAPTMEQIPDKTVLVPRPVPVP